MIKPPAPIYIIALVILTGAAITGFGLYIAETFTTKDLQKTITANYFAANAQPAKIQNPGGGQTIYVPVSALPEKDLKQDSTVKSLAKENIKLKDVIALFQAGELVSEVPKAASRDTLLVKTIYKRDTLYIKAKTINYKDKWLTLSGYVSDSLHVKITERIDVKGALGRGDSKPFGRDAYLLTLTTDNPHVDFQTLKAQTVYPPAKKWYERRGVVFVGGVIVGAFATIGTEYGMTRALGR